MTYNIVLRNNEEYHVCKEEFIKGFKQIKEKYPCMKLEYNFDHYDFVLNNKSFGTMYRS